MSLQSVTTYTPRVTARPERLEEPAPRGTDLATKAQAVADVAAAHAAEVDRTASFPKEGIAAARRNGLMALLVPRELGGAGATMIEVAEACYTLGQACASTAMIVAMHQAALACVVRHHDGSEWHKALLRRVARENLLFASSTTEGNAGGNVRASSAPLVREGGRLAFVRAATVMSYGAEADAIVTTARRDAGAAASDQALVVFLKEDYKLTPTGTWDTLGMRGTCSAGFALAAEGCEEQILPIGYDKIHPQTMVPVSHLAWGAAWTGIAAAAVARAQAFVRTAARKAGGEMPPGAQRCTEAAAALSSLRGVVAAMLARYERIAHDGRALTTLETQAALNLFKVDVSERAVDIVTTAMRACGLAGYRNDGEFALGRHLRDVLSAPIMVHNERIRANIAATALMSGVPATLM